MLTNLGGKDNRSAIRLTDFTNTTKVISLTYRTRILLCFLVFVREVLSNGLQSDEDVVGFIKEFA